MQKLLALLLLSALLVFAQGDVATLSGTVTDPQGAVVPAAQIDVLNANTGQAFKTSTGDRGEWSLPRLGAGTYRVLVTAPGFAKTTTDNVLMNAGVPVTVNTRLEVGSTSESVLVTASSELVQTQSATLSSTVQTRQVLELPYISRGGMDLLVTQAGVQTSGANRNSSINGLPSAALNVTIDGINTQDNYYKNGDGFFTLMPARQDALQEITLTTSAGGADANSGGAATVRFVTKSGTNNFHGGAFYQHRNTWLNANNYVNNSTGQPRNRQIIHQGGFNVGGPIIKNKLVFFTNYELFRYPATGSVSRVVANPTTFNGDYTYMQTTGVPKTVNVLTMAGAAGFSSTPDSILLKTLQQINGYVGGGLIQDRIASNSDYNRSNLLYSPKGMSNYWTDTTRLDYNINDKHTFSLVYTYYKNGGKYDVTNSVFNAFPGTGAIIGQDDLVVNQSGNRYSVSGALRSSLTSRLTNEFRFGANRGISMFRPQIASGAQFSQWKGYYPTLGFSLSPVSVVTGSSRRTSPVRELHDTVAYQFGNHNMSFGADATQVNLWYVTSGTSVIPQIAFGAAANDPITTGGTNLFTSTSMPNSNSTYQGEAAALYSLLTGRVSSISRSLAFDGTSYKATSPTDRDRQYEYGFFGQDAWRIAPSFTLNLGVRFEIQEPWQNRDNAYSAVSYQSLWGVSGVGRLFQPGTTTSQTPTFDRYTSGYYSPLKLINPSIGFAWQLPKMTGFLGKLMGEGGSRSVLRAGYAINSIRNGSNTFQSMLGSNTGLNFDTGLSPSTYAADFGAPGSVLFSQANLPVRSGIPTAPQYPIAATTSTSLNGYDPALKMPYVQSWNLGFQRQLSENMVMEVRYVGNHGLKLFRQINLNEINTFENGFQKDFYQAQTNLFVNRGCQGNPAVPAAWNTCANPTNNSFAYNGLPGQGAIPVIQTAFNGTSDQTTANNLRQNRPGTMANTYATTAANMNRLTNAGYQPNFFMVNPTVANGGSYLLLNAGSSYYDALQVEVNRRFAKGVMLQFSYAWSKSLVNGSQNSAQSSNSYIDYSAPTTLRNWNLDKVPGGYDLRHALKMNGIYELPFGPGRHFLANTPVLKKIMEGWEVTGIARVQSGAPFQLTSGRSGMNNIETGVVLMNMTAPQFQDMVEIRKTTSATSSIKGANGTSFLQPMVYYLPQSLIDNTNAAFELNGKGWANLDATAPYISPQLTPGSFGYQVYFRQPWQYHFDAALLKRMKIREKVNVEFQANFMNVLNLTNFLYQNAPSSTSFGRLSMNSASIYNDLSNNYDPGSRVIELRLRLSF